MHRASKTERALSWFSSLQPQNSAFLIPPPLRLSRTLSVVTQSASAMALPLAHELSARLSLWISTLARSRHPVFPLSRNTSRQSWFTFLVIASTPRRHQSISPQRVFYRSRMQRESFVVSISDMMKSWVGHLPGRTSSVRARTPRRRCSPFPTLHDTHRPASSPDH